VENKTHELFLRYTENAIDDELNNLNSEKNKNYKIEKLLDSYSSLGNKKSNNDYYAEAWISNDLRFSQSNVYQIGFLKNTRIKNLLGIIDFYWTEHIERMSYIRETINWRSYGQQNPLLEYNNQGFKSFKRMFEEIRTSMLYYFINKKITN
jgi:preprotein translocase subunit SecA